MEELAPHVRCAPESVAPFVLLPGDPRRTERVASFLQDGREVAFNREFRTITGSYNAMPVSATSTGIGGPSLIIAVEELIRLGARYFIRIGSCGAVRPHLRIGDLVVANGAMREDGGSRMYAPDGFPAVPDFKLTNALLEAADRLSQNGPNQVDAGIVRSHDSFYTDSEETLMKQAEALGVLASDMESAALFVVARLRGAAAASILNVVVTAGGDLESGIGELVRGEKSADAGERREVQAALEAFLSIWRQEQQGTKKKEE